MNLDTLYDADKLNQHGKTILHVESELGNTERVKFILRHFSPNGNLLVKLSKYDRTALYLAARYGKTEVVEVLIEAARHLPSSSSSSSANPVTSFQAFLRHSSRHLNTALHVAAMYGHVAIVKLLVEADPTDRHIQNNEGKTPTYLAAEKGFNDIVEIILTTCTDPSLDGPRGSTILHVEAINGNAERVRFILTKFANKNLHSARDLPPSASATAFIGQGDKDGNTALHFAAEKGHVDIVKLLVDAQPHDIHIKNSYGRTPIYIAAEKGFNHIVEIICTTCTDPSLDGPAQQIYEDVIRMIIIAAKRSTTPPADAPYESFEALFNYTDESGCTILEEAVMGNHVNMVELILVIHLILLKDPACQRGRPNTKYGGLMSLICKAIDEKYEDIVELLSRNYETGGYQGAVALILAIKKRDKDSVLRQLHDAKHLATFVDDKGWTPLHYAAFHEFDLVLDAIIELTQKDETHQFIFEHMEVQTPLLVAAEKGNTSTVIRLMELLPTSSPEYTAVNNDGRNILHLAAAENKKEMIQGILKYCPEKYKDKILKQQDVINGDTPLHLLISHGCYIPELIKHKGLDTMAKNKKNWTPRDMLYFEDDIIADQVKIKIALDDVQTNQSQKFWRKNMKKTDISESLVPPSKREKKDKKFNIYGKVLMDEKRAQKKKDLERYKKRTSTQIVVATLITTVTFTVGFAMPGGLHQSGEVDEGLVVLTKKAAFNAFIVSDALAFLLSTCSLFLYFLESMYEDPHQVSKLSAASVGLNIVSVMAMMLTFITGTYVVLSHSAAIAITVCLIGSFFFIFVVVLLIKMVYDRQVESNED